ncbi:hypothetical protein MMSR116_11295 [Methylobacterium mesophilicum SR1.6/6]|uniref:Uncharacterized protein n=1 Tax=Methylobacterium mesophilicum SR1.6/6 TaxID=908290 RepID=A0A6B9FMJ3_9HYPH|nr:hypothetical protein [Methylobacterium mesophilicum]QGY02394.1 hypothetical protein MMSR116_11295 [Methylobacterium mesophilicum SR1.6/6]
MAYDDAVETTLMSLAENGPAQEHRAMASSGGEEPAVTPTLTDHLIVAGRLALPMSRSSPLPTPVGSWLRSRSPRPTSGHGSPTSHGSGRRSRPATNRQRTDRSMR